MNFTTGLSQARRVIEMFSSVGTSSQSTTAQPRGVVWARYAARLAILGMALFIFVWWPVDTYDPEGFDAWSARMEALPQEVWYVLLGVILSWGTTEVVAARVGRTGASFPSMDESMNNQPYGFDDDVGFVNDGASAGRFANLDDDATLFDNITPNASIEEWQNASNQH